MVLFNLSSTITIRPVEPPMVGTDYAINLFLQAEADGQRVSLTEVWHNLRWTIDGLNDDDAFRFPFAWSICLPVKEGTHDFAIAYYTTLPKDSPVVAAELTTTAYSAMVANNG